MSEHPSGISTSVSASKSASLEELRLLTDGRLCPRATEISQQRGVHSIVHGVASIGEAGPQQITWVANARFGVEIATSRAGVVLVPEGFGLTPMPAIIVKDIATAIARTLAFFEPARERPATGIHPSAVVAASAKVDPTAAIGAHVRIGEGSTVGAGTAVHPGAHLAAGVAVGRDCNIGVNVYIADHCRLGNRVVLKPGAVIGSDGFGFYFKNGKHNVIPQIGTVVLEDDVQIGANTCVDRAKVATTIVGRGTKVDNLVQIGHNSTFGAHCVLTAQVGISGNTRVGNGVIFAGQSGSVQDIAICDGARLGARTVATKDIDTAGDYLGFPAQPVALSKRQAVAQRRLPELLATIQDLTRRIADLEARSHPHTNGQA